MVTKSKPVMKQAIVVNHPEGDDRLRTINALHEGGNVASQTNIPRIREQPPRNVLARPGVAHIGQAADPPEGQRKEQIIRLVEFFAAAVGSERGAMFRGRGSIPP